MKTLLALCMIAGAALPAGAEDILKRPKGCELIATVQDDHCAAKNIYRCSEAGPIAFWTEVHYGGGKVEVHTDNANHGGIEIISPAGGSHYSLTAQGDHPRVALETGSARRMERATISRAGKSQKATMSLSYTYQGETRKLAGETFHRLNYITTITFPSSGSTLSTSGSVLYHAQLDLLVDEVEVSDGQGGPARKIKLRSLSFEGQKGFNSTKPKYGCN